MQTNIKKKISENVRAMISAVYDQIKDDVKNINGELFNGLLSAYNKFQEDERESANYIYDITDKKDVIACLNGNMPIEDVSNIYRMAVHDNIAVRYYIWSRDYVDPHTFKSYDDVVKHIMMCMETILYYVMCYPEIKEYQYLYSKYIYEAIMDDYYDYE